MHKGESKRTSQELIIWASIHVCFGFSEDHILNESVCVCVVADQTWKLQIWPSWKCVAQV